MDLPDNEIVVQWRSTGDMSTLWRRFGCVVRGIKKSGIAIFLVDKKEFEAERQARADRAAKRKKKKDAKKGLKEKNEEEGSPSKRLALAPQENAPNQAVPVPLSIPIPLPAASTSDAVHRPDLDEEESDVVGLDKRIGLQTVTSMEREYARIDRELMAGKSKGRGVTVIVGGSIDHFINPGNVGYEDSRRPSPREYFGVKGAQGE